MASASTVATVVNHGVLGDAKSASRVPDPVDCNVNGARVRVRLLTNGELASRYRAIERY